MCFVCGPTVSLGVFLVCLVSLSLIFRLMCSGNNLHALCILLLNVVFMGLQNGVDDYCVCNVCASLNSLIHDVCDQSPSVIISV